MSNRDRQIEVLKASAEARKREVFSRADEAIRRLALGNEKITFSAVAEAGGVSLAYLYKQKELKRRIQALRLQREDRLTVVQAKKRESNASNQVLVKQLRQRVKELEAKRLEQKREIEALAGQLYELSLEKENTERLLRENKRLREQIEKRKRDSPTPSALTRAVRDTLTELKMKPSRSLSAILASYSEKHTLRALDALKEAQRSGRIRSPTGFLIEALRGNWEANDLGIADEKERKEFSSWFELARETGLVQVSRGTPKGIEVLTSEGKWLLYKKLIQTPAFSLKKLQKT